MGSNFVRKVGRKGVLSNERSDTSRTRIKGKKIYLKILFNIFVIHSTSFKSETKEITAKISIIQGIIWKFTPKKVVVPIASNNLSKNKNTIIKESVNFIFPNILLWICLFIFIVFLTSEMVAYFLSN